MSEPVYILGAGMHPWGKWDDRDFTEYGVVAARSALRDAGLDWRQIQLVAGADTIRNGYPGFVAGATFAQKLGWTGVPVSSSYAACASGSQALQSARAQILAGLCDVALVVGADKAPKGFFAPVGGERKNDPDWQRFHLIGATNPVYFALLARRRMALYGATGEDFAAVKVKNARHGLNNPNARYRKETTVSDVLASNIVSDPLHLLEICAVSDGAAAIVLGSEAQARQRGGHLIEVAGCAIASGQFGDPSLRIPNVASAANACTPHTSEVVGAVQRALAMAGVGPQDIDLLEMADNTAWHLLAWPELFGFYEAGQGDWMLAQGELDIDGRCPLNPSGGFLSFGEATTAQGVLQVCELLWQLRGQAQGHQVEGARLAMSAVLGLGANGASVILKG